MSNKARFLTTRELERDHSPKKTTKVSCKTGRPFLFDLTDRKLLLYSNRKLEQELEHLLEHLLELDRKRKRRPELMLELEWMLDRVLEQELDRMPRLEQSHDSLNTKVRKK